MVKAILGFVAFIFLILFIAIAISRGGDNSGTSNGTQSSPLSEAADSEANFRFVESGPIVAEENHFSIEIAINERNRTIKVIRGYNGEVVASRSFANSQSAFSDFLGALDRSGYTGSRNTRFDTEQGLCPQGRRYAFESDQFNESFRRWTTNCQEKGNFGGNFSNISRLFRDQIPEYNKFISETRTATGLRI